MTTCVFIYGTVQTRQLTQPKDRKKVHGESRYLPNTSDEKTEETSTM